MSVNMSGSGAVGLGVGVGSYQPRVYVPLKALFLVIACFNESQHTDLMSCYISYRLDRL